MGKIFKTFHIKTFGCAMNQSDSERIAAFLERKGFAMSENQDESDLVIFNTCGIKQAPENRIYSLISNIRKSGRSCKIVLTGCLANRPDVQKRMRNKVDLFTEIKNFQKDFNFTLHPVRNTSYKIQDTKNITGKEDIDYLSINPKHGSDFEAFIPIMTGCNNFCSYCVVPYARGREVSRPAKEIISEAKRLVEQGYKHLILLGQNVNSYHGTVNKEQETRNNNQTNSNDQLSNIQKNSEYEKLSLRGGTPLKQSRAMLSSGSPCIFEYKNSRDDMKGQIDNKNEKFVSFPELLKKINAIPGKFWISFVSSHPKDMSDELIESMAKSKKVCEWIHLPIQAGDDKILSRMNRKYTGKHYLSLIEKTRAAFKEHKPASNYSISSDIIVGFPGETKSQFLKSAEIMEEVGFDMVYFGQFSPRPGTAAWKMKDNVSREEKKRREDFLNEILKKTALKNNLKYVGKKMEVLIEKEKEGSYFGKTRTMKNVKIPASKKDLIGKIIKVKITKANTWNLEGEI